MSWVSKSISTIWDAVLKNVAASIATVALPAIYFAAIGFFSDARAWIRAIPSDYVAAVLIVVMTFAAGLALVHVRLRNRISKLLDDDDFKNTRFVTHYGVWWKLKVDAEYVEDFPYCPCCEPRKKIVQTDWHPEEKFVCPQSKQQIQLFDGVPRDLNYAREQIYSAYFGPRRFWTVFEQTYRKLADLHKGMDETTLLELTFKEPPMKKIPAKEVALILKGNKTYPEVRQFFFRHYNEYSRHLRKAD